MKKLSALLICASLFSCTYNISMVHTEGSASDVIDETSANTPTLNATIPPLSLYRK
jgi:hypothetical protein